MDESTIDGIFTKHRTVSVVGLSKDQSKDSYKVAKFLLDRGFTIVPVNPTATEILGLKAYPSITHLPDEIKSQLDIVDIFRPSADVPPIVDEAIEMKKKFGTPHVIWMQLGIRDDNAAARAESEGIVVVMNRCMMIEGASRKDMLNFRL
ncbi:MAG: CoA-binding protein [Thermoplasmata archaeon]|nr:CoA-binding protein [Candidatus Sysuiplasma acidicola]MBX8638571.1 CoA-binding protein [Candidatus Sysuiplasma acidicola]MBX8647021.1 CoA-binding protein [Candidatus Sysuiplasma acidicola]MDH2905509.1 CoA-binding protein [Methanomassiliicoccales archaeon]